MKFLKGFLIFDGIVIALVMAFLGFVVITDYVPNEVEAVEVVQNSEQMMKGDETFTVTTFNIGYCGLDATQDFFMDGGNNGKSHSYEKTMDNLHGVSNFITEVDSDFYFLQEVDLKARRSYDINQVEAFNELLSDYGSSFGLNYVTKWVPLPLFDPMGYVNSGLLTLSSYTAETSTRYSLPVEESGIVRFFDLDRAMVETIIPLENGKELYVINAHLSAYDEGGVIKKAQTAHIIDYINETYNEDTYMVIGGDWNQLLDPGLVEVYGDELPMWLGTLPDEIYETGFDVAFDSTHNTVRDLGQPYEEGAVFETVIDGFLVSPNLKIINTETHDLGFEHSDHNPVTVTLEFN